MAKGVVEVEETGMEVAVNQKMKKKKKNTEEVFFEKKLNSNPNNFHFDMECEEIEDIFMQPPEPVITPKKKVEIYIEN